MRLSLLAASSPVTCSRYEPRRNQAAGALLAFGGTEAGLGAADLLLQIVALAALSFL